MGRWLRLSLAVVVVAACSGPNAVTSTNSAANPCLQVTGDLLEENSVVEMTIEPNPVPARQTAELTVTDPGLGDEASIGVDADWQCWDGSEWVTTHIVYRGFGESRGETIAVNPDFQIRVPDIVLWADRGYSIAIPQVDPGIYRITDEISVDDEQVPGFVFVEVTAP